MRLRAPLWVAAGVLAATVALRLRDPHQHGSWGLCPFKLLTGWDCPGCGGLRAVNDLTRLDFASAWHSNAVFVAALPFLVFGWLLWVRRAWRGETRRVPSSRTQLVVAISAGAVLVAFTIWRNTPWGSAFHVA